MTKEQELSFLRILYATIVILGFFFFPLWFINIQVGKRIKKIEEELKNESI